MSWRRSAVVDGARLVGALLSTEANSPWPSVGVSAPEEYAKPSEVAVAEFKENFRVHRVVPKCGLLLTESEAS